MGILDRPPKEERGVNPYHIYEEVEKVQDPYPIDLCSIKNDKDLCEAIPDPQVRTAVAWYLCGCGFRTAKAAFIDRIYEFLDG